MKEYEKAVETFNLGLKHDPENEELKEGINRCIGAISRFATGQVGGRGERRGRGRLAGIVLRMGGGLAVLLTTGTHALTHADRPCTHPCTSPCVHAPTHAPPHAPMQASEDEVKERQARSMADPEVQNILKDPVMQNVLRDFQVRHVMQGDGRQGCKMTGACVLLRVVFYLWVGCVKKGGCIREQRSRACPAPPLIKPAPQSFSRFISPHPLTPPHTHSTGGPQGCPGPHAQPRHHAQAEQACVCRHRADEMSRRARWGFSWRQEGRGHACVPAHACALSMFCGPWVKRWVGLLCPFAGGSVRWVWRLRGVAV